MRRLLTALSLVCLPSCGPKATAYPLSTCLISGQKLGAHGEPYTFTRDGQEVKWCCESCLEDFDKDAAKLMPKIKEALPKK
jgi:hypothetical protein